MTATAPHLPLSRSPSSLPPPKTFLSDESFLPLNVRNFSTPSLFLSLFFSLSPSYLTQFPLFSSSFCLGLRLRRRKEGGRKGEEKFCLLLRPAIERGRRERPAKETSSLFFLFVLLLLLPRRPQRQKGMGEGRPSKEAAPPLLSLLPSSSPRPPPPPPPRALVP